MGLSKFSLVKTMTTAFLENRTDVSYRSRTSVALLRVVATHDLLLVESHQSGILPYRDLFIAARRARKRGGGSCVPTVGPRAVWTKRVGLHFRYFSSAKRWLPHTIHGNSSTLYVNVCLPRAFFGQGYIVGWFQIHSLGCEGRRRS